MEKHMKHEKKFAGMTEEGYEQKGVKLLESTVGRGVEVDMDALGNIVKYNKYKNWLAIGNNGGVWIFYAPKYGHRQFLDDMRSALKHGGKK